MKITNNKCTGCGTCSAVCPKSAIRMEEDLLAEKRPKVDVKLCVNCGRCQAVCPQNAPAALSYPIKCYALWSKQENDWTFSASGGAMPAFARVVCRQGGYVYGCDYSQSGELVFSGTNESDTIDRFRSSKYSRGDAYRVFPEIKDRLNDRQTVLFVGTPCQVAGLKRFLAKDYETLIAVDLVCHGTPPNHYLQKHLKRQGVKPPIQRIRFRGEYDQQLTAWKDNRIVYQKSKDADRYFRAFYANAISYDACYSCVYAQAKRASDITLGDFWGLGELSTIRPKSRRPSLMLINTEKGTQLLSLLKDEVIWEQRSVEEGVRGNGRLNSPPGKTLTAKLFRGLYPLCGFSVSVQLAFFFTRVHRALKRRAKKLIKKQEK